MKNAKVKWMWPDPLKLVNLDADKELENLALRLNQVDHYAEAIFSEPSIGSDLFLPATAERNRAECRLPTKARSTPASPRAMAKGSHRSENLESDLV